MRLDVLISCMHQTDGALIERSKITGGGVMINQCDTDGVYEYKTANSSVKAIFTRERGLTKSRNLAIRSSFADVCVLCDDDEVFVENYEEIILSAYEELKDADVVIFNTVNRKVKLGDKVKRLRFPQTMKVSSWQISFKRESLLRAGVAFDELMGAGSGNGAEEELKFLTDCERKKLKIYYVPKAIASVAQSSSTWFSGFDEQFFINRGYTTRYIMGAFLASVYAVYYALAKRNEYKKDITFKNALKAIFKGIKENKISKLKNKD